MSSSVEPQEQNSTSLPRETSRPSNAANAGFAAGSTPIYKKYRAPKENETAFVSPAYDSLAGVLQQSSFGSETSGLRFCDLALSDAREQARQEAISLAIAHCAKYTDRFSDLKFTSDIPIVMAGHQPDLFHAGVWFKNFLLSSLAKSTNSISLNFAVDNDLCRSTSIRLPAKQPNGTLSHFTAHYDAARAPLPWEMRSLESESTWNAFPGEVTKHVGTSASPLIHDLWPIATKAIQDHGNIGRALSQARHTIELAEQVDNLEVSLSDLVSTRTFARFSIQLLSDLERFQQVYNEQCESYRQAHKIRNRAHPVPNLEQIDGWFEAPLWIYRSAAPTRQRLWVRKSKSGLVLSDRAGWQEMIEGQVSCEGASRQWLDLISEGVRLRPRALLTTMYLRVMIADLFVHGIGGGKYDQVTDGIIREFFGLQPPTLAVATATVRLPQIRDTQNSTLEQLESRQQQLKSQKWRLQHNPQPNDEQSDNYSKLLHQKESLLSTIPPKGERWSWHHELKKVNEQLLSFQQQQLTDLDNESERLAQQIREAKISDSREYAYCLFDRDYLAGVLRELASPPQA